MAGNSDLIAKSRDDLTVVDPNVAEEYNAAILANKAVVSSATVESTDVRQCFAVAEPARFIPEPSSAMMPAPNTVSKPLLTQAPRLRPASNTSTAASSSAFLMASSLAIASDSLLLVAKSLTEAIPSTKSLKRDRCMENHFRLAILLSKEEKKSIDPSFQFNSPNAAFNKRPSKSDLIRLDQGQDDGQRKCRFTFSMIEALVKLRRAKGAVVPEFEWRKVGKKGEAWIAGARVYEAAMAADKGKAQATKEGLATEAKMLSADANEGREKGVEQDGEDDREEDGENDGEIQGNLDYES